MSHDLLRFVAAHGLPGQRSTPAPITAGTVDELLAVAAEEKLVGLLDQAVADGAVTADVVATDRIGEEAVRIQAWTLLVERHHLEVHKILAGAGADTRFLKGPAVAHRFYEHPGLRTFVDVDVLVRADQLDYAVGVLTAAGHTRRQPEIAPGFSARYGKSVTLLSGAGIEVDLHRTFASGPFGLVRPPDALWEREAGQVVVGDDPLPVLDAPASLVHSCVHAVTGQRTRLGTLRDVVELADQEAASRDLAAQLGVTACVSLAAELAARTLDLPDQDDLATMAAWPRSAREQRWLDGYEGGRSWRAGAIQAVSAVPGTLAKVRYVAALGRASISRSARRAME